MNCYVCDLQRDDFIKQNLNFEKHRIEDHNQWDYFYYLIYLTQKNILDLNGFETFVIEKYNNGEISWFPIGKALIFENEDKANDVEDKLELIDSKLGRLVSKLNEIDLNQ